MTGRAPHAAAGSGSLPATRDAGLAGDKLFCFGLGYSAMALGRRLDASAWRVGGTCRGSARRGALEALGLDAAVFDGGAAMDPMEALAGATHVLTSVPPDADGDPVLRWHGDTLAAAEGLRWVGYFSTTGVYGDHGGAWVDEESELRATSDRGRRRIAAERAWLEWGRAHGIAVHVFRLAGIYGPGRSAIDQVRRGTARRIVKAGHLFSRIHVEDIATVLEASVARPDGGAVYNVCDDEPAASADVVAYACTLLGVEPPAEIPFADAELAPMAKSFWADSRRVRNDRIKTELGAALAFPDYRSGLRAIAGL